MRNALVAMTAFSVALLCASIASPQVGIGSMRVSADRLPMAGEDTSSYWGMEGGTANAASGGQTDHGAAKPYEKPRVDEARK
jgi:hypothetical protein